MSFETETEFIQEIANAVTVAIPLDDEWTSISLHAELDPPTGMLEFTNTYTDQNGVQRAVPFSDKYIALFRGLGETVGRGRPQPVRQITIAIAEDGSYRSTYGYEENNFPEMQR